MFVTLFNLQGARRSQRRVFILARPPRFVKYFFQLFFADLKHFPRGASAPVSLAGDLHRLPLSPANVKGFFQIFRNFSTGAVSPPVFAENSACGAQMYLKFPLRNGMACDTLILFQ